MSEQIQNAAPEAIVETNSPETENTEALATSAGNPEAVVADLKEQAEDPTLSKKEKKEIQKRIKEYELKIDGKVERFSLDLDNDEEVKKHLQMSKVSQKRMAETAEIKKAAEDFLQLLRTNPRRVLADPNIGVDLKKIAQEFLQEEIENASKSPEQREAEKLRKELQDYKEKAEKDEKSRKDSEYKRMVAEHQEKIESGIEDALKSSNLPKSPYTVRKMAELMTYALKNNIDISPKDVVPLLQKQMNEDIKELFSASSDDVLEALVGKDRINTLRKKAVDKVKKSAAAPQTANSVKETTGKPETAPKKEEKIDLRKWLRS